MNVLYIGKFFPQKMLQTIVADSKGKIGMSNHNFEMSIINGLCQHKNNSLKCLSVPGVYSFPYNNKRLFTKHESYEYNGAYIRTIGFCNLPVIKEICATIGLLFQIMKCVSDFDGKNISVIINTPDNRILSAVRIFRSLTRKTITQTVIIPDIPAMVTSMDKQKLIKGFFLKYRNRCSMKMTSQSNGLVLLTEAMMDFVDKPMPYIVMEGIVDVKTMDVEIADDNANLQKEIILYTGTLRKIFGVLNLVEAFKKIDNSEVELWICGSGDSKDVIEEAARHDSRIKFFGLVDSRTALKMQRKASILVNPRTSEGAYTKYSFPSKTMEYLLSGKSVIINRLPGIPEEYYQYVYTPNGESVNAMVECISAVLAMNKAERRDRAVLGKKFIYTKKNSKVQTGRILSMIEKYQKPC